jgi:hypothetical protein
MSASGCAAKCVASSASNSVIWRFSSTMMPTAALLVAAKRGGERRGRGELLGAQHCRDLLGAGIEVGLSPSVFEG